MRRALCRRGRGPLSRPIERPPASLVTGELCVESDVCRRQCDAGAVLQRAVGVRAAHVNAVSVLLTAEKSPVAQYAKTYPDNYPFVPLPRELHAAVAFAPLAVCAPRQRAHNDYRPDFCDTWRRTAMMPAAYARSCTPRRLCTPRQAAYTRRAHRVGRFAHRLRAPHCCTSRRGTARALLPRHRVPKDIYSGIVN